MLKLNNKTMITQKERIDKGRQAFNDEIIRCSESDNIYEAILEWEFTCEVDCYSNECDYDIVNIIENLIDAGRPDIAYKVSINFKGCNGSGNCICGKNNLIYVYYIQNKINKTVLPAGSDCIKKVFPDGKVFNDILLLDKIIKSSKRSVKKIREENKNLLTENNNLKTENKELKSKIEELKSKIDESENYLKIEEEFSENVCKSFSKDKIELTKKIESLEDENKRLKDIINNLSIYKKMYGSEMDKEFDKLLF